MTLANEINLKQFSEHRIAALDLAIKTLEARAEGIRAVTNDPHDADAEEILQACDSLRDLHRFYGSYCSADTESAEK